MNNLGIPNRKKTALVVIDFQEKLMPVIHQKDVVLENALKLIHGAKILSVTSILTEQYPKGLGHTCPIIIDNFEGQVIEKMTFSCFQNAEVMQMFKNQDISDLIICGVEAHICVLKTCLDAVQQGFTVHVVADAISSRTAENKAAAIQRMIQSGVFVVSTEMILFQLMEQAGTEEFKAISKLIK